ncbi:hypothetical protein ACVOMV_27670 (plasmid) [Mesorhizobium atlanticum]|jgi:uncharacterized membrane protein
MRACEVGLLWPPGIAAMMNGSMWMMGGMALIWILVLIALLLAIAALVKYLRG